MVVVGIAWLVDQRDPEPEIREARQLVGRPVSEAFEMKGLTGSVVTMSAQQFNEDRRPYVRDTYEGRPPPEATDTVYSVYLEATIDMLVYQEDDIVTDIYIYSFD
jgi:hypothetical protein